MSGVLGRYNNVDTIRIVAEKRAIEIDADFNVYTNGSASGGLVGDLTSHAPSVTRSCKIFNTDCRDAKPQRN